VYTVIKGLKHPPVVSKIFKADNDTVVSLPVKMLESLKLTAGEEVSVELDKEHGCIVITPAITNAKGINTKFAKQVADFIGQYRPALDSLAK
jgi:antitoxin component of MazEF toxin-antitoxin module